MPREAWVLVKAMVSDTYPDNSLPGPQPPFPGGGGQPPGIWGPTDPRPTHPIANPGNPNWPGGPPGIWGPTDPRPTPPIYIPIVPPPTDGNPHPEHPIYIPVPMPPDGIWGPNDPRPSNPITNPGDPNNPGAGQPRPPISPEVIEKIKKLVDFLYGNLPENPNPVPTPVATPPAA